MGNLSGTHVLLPVGSCIVTKDELEDLRGDSRELALLLASFEGSGEEASPKEETSEGSVNELEGLY